MSLRLFFLFFTLIYSSGIFSQDKRYRFDHLDIKDGLSQSLITAIHQDKKGYMWFGTQDGLNRYNGYDFDVYRNDLEKLNSIAGNYIYAINSDDSLVYIASNGGLSIFEIQSELFYRDTLWMKGFPKEDDATALLKSGSKIWIGTENNGLLCYDFHLKKWHTYGLKAGQYVNTINKDLKGNIWCLYSGNRVSYIDKSGLEHEVVFKDEKSNSFSFKVLKTMCFDAKDNLLLGTKNGLFVGKPDKNNPWSVKCTFVKETKDKAIGVVFCDKKGDYWVGNDIDGLFYGLHGQDSTIKWLLHQRNVFDPSSLASNSVYSIYQDCFNIIWIGGSSGLNKLDPNRQYFNHLLFKSKEGKVANEQGAWTIAKDIQGKLWIGGRAGLNRVDLTANKSTFYNIKDHRGIPVQVFYVYCDGLNVWICTSDGLYRKNLKELDERAERMFADIPLFSMEEPHVYTMLKDKDSNYWLGTREGLIKISSDNSAVQHFQHNPKDSMSLSNNSIRNIFQDREGVIWVATLKGFNKLIETNYGIKFINHHPKINGHSIPVEYTSFAQAKNHLLYLGSYGHGLHIFNTKTGELEIVNSEDGLPNDIIYGVLKDQHEYLWMSTNRGVVKLKLPEKEITVYKEKDGLQSDEFNMGAYYQDSDGLFYFGGINGISWFDPKKVVKNISPPKVYIDKIIIDDKNTKKITFKPGFGLFGDSLLVLPSSKRNISFEFVAMHYAETKSNTYRYKLDPIDEDWRSIGTQRKVNYSNLSHGNYTLYCYASNSDGTWSQQPTVLKLHIKPYFYETWLFRIGAIVLLALIVLGAFRARIQIIKHQKEVLRRLIESRTSEVIAQKEQIEKQKQKLEEEVLRADNLLYNIFPRETVKELQQYGKARPRNYRTATVMFTDFKDFSLISSQQRPKDLLAKLDYYFIHFDEIIERHGIEKIKTIGDSYMCVGGIPKRNLTNPIDVVLAAMEIQTFMKDKYDYSGQPWTVRIGIHTGELIAGVIGKKRFAYDIWGNTVNVSNRMETACEVGKVNVSGDTYKHIQPYFDCTYRGKIASKNMSEIDMYYVDKIKDRLSVNGDGVNPNALFWEYVDLNLFSSMQYIELESFILRYLQKTLDKNLYYHSVYHTMDVCKAAEKIGIEEGVKGEDLFLLKTAALFHDTGFLKEYKENEMEGMRLAEETLPNYGYTQDHINIIKDLILSTNIKQKPQTLMQKILRDADLDYLGRDDFEEISQKLKNELMDRNLVSSDIEWDKIQLKFFEKHKYYTEYSNYARQKMKKENLKKIKERLSS